MTPKRTRHESTQCEVRTQRSYYAHPWATLRKLWSKATCSLRHERARGTTARQNVFC